MENESANKSAEYHYIADEVATCTIAIERTSSSPQPGCSHWQDPVIDEQKKEFSPPAPPSIPECSLPRAEDELENTTSIHHLLPESRKEECYIPEGRRIFDIQYLFQQIESTQKHEPFDCTISDMRVVGETRKGFHSTFKMKCNLCGKEMAFYNEDPKKKKLPINNAMATGMACIGQGFSQMAEMSAILNMPCMANTTYQIIHNVIASKIRDVAWEQMVFSGKEEVHLAHIAGDVDKDGIPLITVVADGSWAKRSYKNNYNSLSGVACIVGYRTKKVIFIGVRNKYCSICAQAKSKKKEPKEHKCFQNWKGSSTAMEAVIIVQGFKSSIEMHNVKYHQLIGDGDSSIIQRLTRELPYGPELPIMKLECTNHLLRNYCNRLRELVRKSKNEKGLVPILLRKRLGDNLLRLRTAVTSAIATGHQPLLRRMQ